MNKLNNINTNNNNNTNSINNTTNNNKISNINVSFIVHLCNLVVSLITENLKTTFFDLIYNKLNNKEIYNIFKYRAFLLKKTIDYFNILYKHKPNNNFDSNILRIKTTIKYGNITHRPCILIRLFYLCKVIQDYIIDKTNISHYTDQAVLHNYATKDIDKILAENYDNLSSLIFDCKDKDITCCSDNILNSDSFCLTKKRSSSNLSKLSLSKSSSIFTESSYYSTNGRSGLLNYFDLLKDRIYIEESNINNLKKISEVNEHNNNNNNNTNINIKSNNFNNSNDKIKVIQPIDIINTINKEKENNNNEKDSKFSSLDLLYIFENNLFLSDSINKCYNSKSIEDDLFYYIES